jgi:tripartite-type tricarboxylate transporter receptor subunit TctC
MPGSARALSLTAVIAAATAFAFSATAQTYPSAPVRVIVPFAAGGSTDILGRVFSDQLQQSLGQPFTVENRTGAAGQIAAAAFARSTPDGYTLMFTTAAPITVAPQMAEKPQYDPRKDFVPVALVALQPIWFAVNAKSQHKTLADIVKFAKDNPGKLTYGSPGVGSEPHLIAEAVFRSAGVQATHVPFRGGGAIVPALLGGQIEIAALATASIASGLQAGTLRAIAHSSPKRLADFPGVSTFAEVGHKDVTIVPWWGMMAVAGTPQPIVTKLTQELEKIAQTPAVRERLKATFVQVHFAGPAEFNKVLDIETKWYGDIIRAGNFKLGR